MKNFILAPKIWKQNVLSKKSFKSILSRYATLNLCKNSEKIHVIKACFAPMRLADSHVYSYKNKYNLIGGNASNNFKKKKKKKKILQIFVRLFIYSHNNKIQMFSRNIVIRLLRSKTDRWNICYFWHQVIENV